MDKAKSLHGELEAEVFAANTIGRRSYDKSGFKFLHPYQHKETDLMMLRQRFSLDDR